MEACLYDVTISHHRSGPIDHRFEYRSYMWLRDIAQPSPVPWYLRPLAQFRADDHLDIRAALDAEGIQASRIVALSNARVLGYAFDPITVYWCYGGDGSLLAHVAEVHNTYGGRHAYVLPVHADEDTSATVSKAMYVSPFNPVDGAYRIRITPPGDHVSVAVQLDRPGAEPFRASLVGRRRVARPVAIAGLALRYPVAPLLGRARIQCQGVKLWRKGLPVVPR